MHVTVTRPLGKLAEGLRDKVIAPASNLEVADTEDVIPH